MDKNKILTNESLTQFFYKNLNQVNKNSLCPIPQEFILYSSNVLSDYASSDKFFNTNDGRVNEKVLGISFLEAEAKSRSEKKIIYKDVGDTILVQLGLFPDRIKKKNASQGYYINLGKSAYANMETLDCRFYDIPNFYNLFSSSFEYMIELLATMAQANKFNSFEEYLLLSTEESNNLFITPQIIKAS
jgi:hypothetical protein